MIRGDADATASRILGEAYDHNAGFYAFLRTLQTYRQTLAGASPTLLLSPGVDFLGALERGPEAVAGGAAAAAGTGRAKP